MKQAIEMAEKSFNEGGIPIGSGIGILLMLAGGYGAKKVYDMRKKLEDLEKLED